MPCAEEARLATDIDEFYARADAVHSVVHKRTAVGTAGEVQGEALPNTIRYSHSPSRSDTGSLHSAPAERWRSRIA